MSAAPNVFANRYEVVREIARGGMADVYLARDEKLDRPVALKVLSAELSRDPSFVERFRREAQAAANLNQPNIVAVYDWGQEQGTSFIVMEYVDGRTLRDLIRAEGALPSAQVAEIGAQIAAALAFAHRNGVVHRDVKPGNVLLTAAGSVKVTDFGIARAGGANDSLTQTGSVMGTATYFSPEQAQGLPCDGRSDVYSLGVVLYEMATGIAPFTGDSPVSVAYKHVREAVPRPSERVPSIPPELEAIILTALAKEPAERYQSADDLRADLLRFHRGQAVVGGPVTALVTQTADATQVASAVPGPPPIETTVPPKKRGKGPVIAAIVAVVVLIGALAFFLLRDDEGSGGGQRVEVADVGLKPVAEARQILEAQGLEVRVERRANASVPRDLVFRQDPAAGTRVSEGETVLLTVSSGAGTARIPDVEGLSFEEARFQIEDRGFQVQRMDEASDTIPAGQVTRTSPPAATEAEKGSIVQVFVSAGPAPVNVPDVSGLDQVAATQTLVNAGFVVVKVTAPSATVPAGAVIDTEPASGTQAPRGSQVRLIVSSGPEQVTVPNVVNQTQAAATAALQAAGFQVQVSEVASTPANQGRVIAQTPTGGTTADRGSVVTITVGSGSGTTTTTAGP